VLELSSLFFKEQKLGAVEKDKDLKLYHPLTQSINSQDAQIQNVVQTLNAYANNVAKQITEME
jgi:hypothetical protein